MGEINMPLYDYICNDCGHQFEDFSSNTVDEPNQCNHCESIKISRLPSAPGGYYIQGANGASSRPKNAGSFKGKKK